jgi:hypothetical protein
MNAENVQNGPLFINHLIVVTILTHHFNIILPSMSRSTKWSLTFGISDYDVILISDLSHTSCKSCFSHLRFDQPDYNWRRLNHQLAASFFLASNILTNSFWRVVTMVNNTRNFWFSGLYPSSGIWRNTTFRKLDLFPSSGGRGEEDTYSVIEISYF